MLKLRDAALVDKHCGSCSGLFVALQKFLSCFSTRSGRGLCFSSEDSLSQRLQELFVAPLVSGSFSVALVKKFKSCFYLIFC